MNPRLSGAIPARTTAEQPHAGIVKVVLLAESFLPHMNGVTHSLLQVAASPRAAGARGARRIAPRSGPIDHTLYGAAAVLLPSVPLPSYPEVRVTLAGAHRLAEVMRAHEADVVHLASPFVLGWRGVLAAESAGHPERRGLPDRHPVVRRALRRAGSRAGARPGTSVACTVVPPSPSPRRRRRVERPRGARRRAPPALAPRRRHRAVRARPTRRGLAPRPWRRTARSLVGYVGRLAPEKQVEDLRGDRRPAGRAPRRHRRRPVASGSSSALLPEAAFTGFLGGDELAVADGEPRRLRAPRRERDVLPDDPGGAGQRRPGRGDRPRRSARPRAEQRERMALPPGQTSTTCGSGCATSPATTRNGGRSPRGRATPSSVGGGTASATS